MKQALERCNKQKGLTAERVQKFHQFEADESLVGDQCALCEMDVEYGRKLMRLDCEGQHTFCQSCLKEWFKNHNTCPDCGHKFE